MWNKILDYVEQRLGEKINFFNHQWWLQKQKQPSRGVPGMKKSVMKICNKLTGEHPCRSVVSIRLQINYIEITLRHGCSSVSLLYIFRTLFYKNTSGQKKLHRVGSRNLLLFFWIKTFLRHAKVLFPFLRDFRLSFFDRLKNYLNMS